MSERKKRRNTWGQTRIKMDPETGMPLVRDGARWEVDKFPGGWAGVGFPLRVRLMDRNGRVLGERVGIRASAIDVRSAAMRIAAARAEDERRDAAITRLVGAYPPKTLN